jgi:hypothetical protein
MYIDLVIEKPQNLPMLKDSLRRLASLSLLMGLRKRDR